VRPATADEVEFVHEPSYVKSIMELSATSGTHDIGVDCSMSEGKWVDKDLDPVSFINTHI
jgi:hypothetical protein